MGRIINPENVYIDEVDVAKGAGAAATGGMKLMPQEFPVDAYITGIILVGLTTVDLMHEKVGKITTLDPASPASYLGCVRDMMRASSSQTVKDAADDPRKNFYLYHEEAVGGATNATKYKILIRYL